MKVVDNLRKDRITHFAQTKIKKEQQLITDGFALYLEQPIKQLWWPVSSIEAITEFIEISLKIFAADAMVCSSKHTLHIGDESMKPWKPFWGIFAIPHNAHLQLIAAVA